MDKLKLILAGLLTTVYKMSDGEAAELLEKADGDDFDAEATLADLVGKDKARISKISTDKFDQGRNKGKADGLSALETQVREQYGIADDSVKGLDLIKAVHALDREKNKAGVTEDDVKKSPSYIALQKKLDDLAKDVDNRVNAAKVEVETKFDKERTLNKAKAEALKEFRLLNPVLSEDPKKAEKQEAIFLKELDGYDYDETEDGQFIIKKDDKALDDGHGNLVDFKTMIKTTASTMFDFKQSQDRGAPGNITPPTPGAIRVPKTEDEYIKTIGDSSIPIEERNQIKEAWNSKQA